ncbi:MAG: protein kinase, partial [Planctomycetota bacterium]
LEDYFGHFGSLLESPRRVAEIAFEDFRSRSANGHTIAASRWSGLPGITEQSWFRQLASETRFARRDRQAVEADDVFELALSDAGFRLVEQIGSGNFSHVYLATQQSLSDRFVVLKIVAEPMTEPESMAMLQHTNIVPIYSFHQIQSRSVICMPYAGRVTLADFLQTRQTDSTRAGESLVMTVKASLGDTEVVDPQPDTVPSPLMPAADEHAGVGILDKFEGLDCGELATWIFQRLAGALAHSHARGVLHNDLKPSNVLIRNDGEPALLDFNLAHALSGQTPRRVGGTLPYMAPETYQAMMGLHDQSRPHSDIYSLGVMMYEFVTGRLPYAKPTSIADIDLQAAVDQRRVPLSWETRDNVSPGLKSIIERCLAFNPEQRYSLAEQLQSDLQAEYQNRSLTHASEPARYRVQKWTRRHPRGMTGSIVGLCLLAVLIPLGFIAAAFRSEANKLASQNDFATFSKESAEALTKLMADPRRERDANIKLAMKPLDDFGVLAPGGIEHLLSHCEPEERQRASETIQRHIAHLGFLEVNRLTRLKARDELDNAGFGRLDTLIDYASYFEDMGQRARLFLRAKRAELADQTEESLALTNQAEASLATTDSEDYLEAVRLMARRDHEGAITLLNSLADRNTVPSALRWTMIGLSQYNDGQHEDAILSLTQSIERAKNSPTLYILRGLSLMKASQGVRAKTDFRKAIELEPTNFRAWISLGILTEGRDEYAESLETLSKALELSPKNIHALLGRARVYRALGKPFLANVDFDAAMSSDTYDSSSLAIRAQARSLTDPEAALDDLEIALRLEPGSITVQMQIARLLGLRLKRYDESIAMYDKVLEVQPNNELALIDRAVLLAYQGEFDAAIQGVRAAMRRGSARTKYQAACIYALMPGVQQHRRAISFLAGAILDGYKLREDKTLDSDPDLKSLHQYEDYQIISRTHELFRRNRRRGQTADRGRASLRHVSFSQPSGLIKE